MIFFLDYFPMRPKFLLLLSLALPLLASCNRGELLALRLGITMEDATKRDELITASARVVERRIQRMGVKPEVTVERTELPSIVVTVPDRALATDLTNELSMPFSLELMRRTGSGETADFTSDIHGAFSATGIDHEDISWVQSQAHPLTGKGRVRIVFTETGREEMKRVFRESQGKELALLVRGVLVSKLATLPEDIVDAIVIEDIPTPDIAQTFADDVNVGKYVTFTPAE